MSTSTASQDQATIHALNIHGIFFERRCATAVGDTPGWKTLATNYPVEFPPPNGPWRGKESSLDIWARKNTDSSFVIDAFIECKKANPEFVNWVFFPKHNVTQQTALRFFNTTTTSNSDDSGQWSIQTQLKTGTTTIDIASDAREVRGDYINYKGGNKTKTSNAAIQDASYQVALACRAINHEESVLLQQAQNSSEHPSPPWGSKVYIPIVVTTANLFRIDFSPNSTNLTSGEILAADATLSPVQSVIYEYAIPKHLQYSPAKPLEVLKTGDTETFSRMHIFVVRADAISSFLNQLFT